MNYLEKQGFGDYLDKSPQIKESLQDLENTKNNRSLLFKLLSMVGSTAMAHKIGLGGSIANDAASAGLGLAASAPVERAFSDLGGNLNKISQSINKKLPNRNNSSGMNSKNIKKLLSSEDASFSDIAKAALKSAILPTNQQPYRD